MIRSRKLGHSLRRIVLALAYAAGTISLAGAQGPQPKSALKIVDILFEDFHGEMRARFSMDAGGMVSLTFGVAGFSREPVETASGLPGESVHLTYGVELLDPQGLLVEPAKQGEVRTVLGPRDEQWRPKIHWSASVPEYAPPGEYRVRIEVRDIIARHETVETATFQVHGEPLQPAESLQVQQVEYARSEEEPWFSERYFSPADAIQVRYQVAGFRVSPDKQVWIEQDWTVLNPEGKVAASQRDAVVVKQQYFYLPRLLPTRFELRLEDPQPGAYILRIAVRDRIGEQSASFDSNFVIRP